MNNIKKYLEESSWYKGRQKDISYLNEELAKNELDPLNKIISNFLQEFHYVNLNLPNGYDIHINVDDTLLYIGKEIVSLVKSVIKEPLIPIGMIHEGSAILFMSNSGKISMLTDGKGLFLIGNNFETALNNIINNENIVPLN